MKTSLYNHEAYLQEGTGLFFNFYTLNLLELSPTEAKVAKGVMQTPDKNPAGGKASSLRNLLIEKGFLINDGVDERALLKAYRLKSKNQTTALGLTIAPTVVCNFSCAYCYEGHKRRSMTPDVEDALVHFVQGKIRKEGSLSVVWFGGEPLLGLDSIQRLSGRFMDICEKASSRYSADIITNGYLLDKRTLEVLTGLSIRKAQITLDGPEEVHDRRRPLKNGGKTFARILANVKEAADLITISLRMNVDQTNRDRIDDMLDLLVKEGLHTRIGFHIGHTSPYTEACQDVSETCLTNEDFSLLSLETLMKMIDRGFTSAFHTPQKRDTVCLAENGRASVVTPSGGIVNCWNDIDNSNAEIGHLLKSSTGRMEKNAQRWEKKDPFELECYDCMLLPICMGGCPYFFIKDGKVHCHPWKYNLDESLTLYFFLQKTRRERKIAQAFHEAVESVKGLKAARQTGEGNGSS